MILFELIIEKPFSQYYYKQQINKSQEYIKEKEEEIKDQFKLFSSLSPDSIKQELFALRNTKKEVYWYLYESDSLKAWSENTVVPKIRSGEENELRLQLLGNGYYLQMTKIIAEQKVVALIPVYRKYQINNSYLKDRYEAGHQELLFFENPVEAYDGFYIKDQSGSILYALEIPDKNILSQYIYWISAILLFLLNLFLIK